jgi:hypothetical protein
VRPTGSPRLIRSHAREGTVRSGRRAFLLALLLVAAPGAARGQAPGGEYDTVNTAWNGLSTLDALARGMGFEVVPQAALSWDEIEPTDVLFILYPTAKIEPSHLSRFLRNGGRVLLADDFGRGEEALRDLEILRGPGAAAAADSFWDDQTFAPIAKVLDPAHPLAAGVETITTNVPAIWRDLREGSRVFGFDDGSVLVAAVEVGDGRLVALSDPSVLINRMLEFEGNLAFAINLLRWLERPGVEPRLILMAGDLSLLGQPSRQLGVDPGAGTVGGMLGDFNAWLQSLQLWVPTDLALRVIAVLAALVLALLAVVILPRVRRAPLDGSWTRARGGGGLATPEKLLADLDRAGRGTSFALPAAILRDSINTRLALALGQPDALFALPENALLTEVASRFGPAAAAALASLMPQLRATPSRAQAASPFQAAWFGQREFERMSADADRLYRNLGEEAR